MGIFRTFGKHPTGKRLALIESSPQYKNDQFENTSPTPMMIGRSSFLKMAWRFMNKPRNTKPPGPLPTIKTDLKNLAGSQPMIVWFGHSSYFIRIDGKNILVDPVFSGHASPFSFSVKSFAGTDIYTVDDLPDIDILIITHDHFDHLDYSTMRKLKNKVRTVCTSLGVGSHLVYWGFDDSRIVELDWGESINLNNKEHPLELIAAPARHFSGRTFKRGKTLWSSFILKTDTCSIYIGGDSGYDTHFVEIGHKYGPFDIALLECGQYNIAWPLIHMMPEEVVQSAIDLRASILLPVHWGKFSLAFHPWQEPVERVLAKAKELNVQVTTPMIGQLVTIGTSYPEIKWWEKYPHTTKD